MPGQPSALQLSRVVEICGEEHVKRGTILGLLEEIPRRAVDQLHILSGFLVESGGHVLHDELQVRRRCDRDLLGFAECAAEPDMKANTTAELLKFMIPMSLKTELCSARILWTFPTAKLAAVFE